MKTNAKFGHASMPPENRLLTEREAAAQLGVSARNLYTIRCRGEIGWVRVGRFLVKYRQEDIDAYIAQQRQAPERAAVA
jgi:excisionase family DNA binding protein